MFHSARLKLTLTYTVAIAIVMALFSIALYIALQGAQAGSLELSGNPTTQVEQAVLAAEFHRARLVLVVVNAVGWVLAALASYIIAGRTLKPIEEALARQRQFTAHASHELRTPLTVMKGEIDVTLTQDRAPDEYRRVLSLIETEIDQLDEMADDLLTLARIEASPRMREREERDLGDVVRETVELYAPKLIEREVNVDLTVPPHLRARLDWARFRHLLANLVDNAVRHTPCRGRINVRVSEYSRGLELVVFNTGSPIRESDLPNIFIPFYRGQGSAPDTGTGLGLALCEWVTRAHGGSIMARNEPNGVSFVVRLPQG